MYILSSSTRLYVACEQALWGTLVVGRGGGGGGFGELACRLDFTFCFGI